ncbi:uncharacterized protein ATC70_007939 [Mucor velutinosus]|uniref:Uncharacterized protein n=1 Tax=Mucor velutinosus TaxID=708070 RepID=A0AAN7HWC5_9FUNG|nr:hypothetical protein ATC70_007939 [Mucor velutinosus]
MGFEPPLIPTASDNNDASQPFNDFNQSTSTSDLPDDDDLVDKLFRESMQDMHQHQAMDTAIDIKQPDNSLHMLLSSPPPMNAPMVNRKRSRSPEKIEQASSSFVPVEQPTQQQPSTLHNDPSAQVPQSTYSQRLTSHLLSEFQQRPLPPAQQQPPALQQPQQRPLLLQQHLQARQPLPGQQNLPRGLPAQSMAQHSQPSHQQHPLLPPHQAPQHGTPTLAPINKVQPPPQQQQPQQRRPGPYYTPGPAPQPPFFSHQNTFMPMAPMQHSTPIRPSTPPTITNNFQNKSNIAPVNPAFQHLNMSPHHQKLDILPKQPYQIPNPRQAQAYPPNSISEPMMINASPSPPPQPRPLAQPPPPQPPMRSATTIVLKTQSAAQKAAAIPPRPQLKLHFTRHGLDSTIFDDPTDPMKPDLDIMSLRKLTVATLCTLNVNIALEELPKVDIEEPLSTDSHQVLPAAAMQVITKMVLGTSGDKEVAQTLASQISNGDLVAFQRLIVAGLRSKNIVIHTVLNEQTSANDGTKRSASPDDTVIDLTHVRYEPPHNVTRLFLRLYRYILNMLLSTPDCWPFIQPVPETAFLYHQEIKNPMDLYTIEENIWRGKYTKFARFENDMQRIWKNAKLFHRSSGTIPRHAENLESLFTKIVMDIKRQNSKNKPASGPHDFQFDPTNTLPEESDFSYPPIEQVFSETSTVYTISALSPLEPKARKAGLKDENSLYLQLNGPFFQAVERMKSDLDGNHRLVPRFYIAKNRTLLRQVRSQGVLAIFYNTKTTRVRHSKNIRIETDMVLAYPASEFYDLDQINECTVDFSPKGWIHLRPLRVVNRISFEANDYIDRDYFRRMFATAKMATDDKNGHHNAETKILLKRIVRQILGLPEKHDIDIPETPVKSKPIIKLHTFVKGDDHRPIIQQRMLKTKEEEAMEADEGSDDEKPSPKSIDVKSQQISKSNIPTISNEERLGTREVNHEVWRKLFDVCTRKGISIRNITSHGNINWNSPDSEGFFKRVYFFDNIVVQAFRQMTMYQRITEVACLMKLRNLPHMAQMREILFNDNGDVAGLSMERYQTTLKRYAHVHSHHRLSAYQKYDVIYQMLLCMKTIHKAGLAHRDLSEVNIMLNTLEGQFLEDGSEKVYLYLIDFGKAVFCESTDVRDWFVDVPRADWEYDGDVVPETKEELDAWCESLPWVKGKPDHGYRMYRSIQTLPKTRSDNQVLPWLIHPQAEDIYSIGVMIWKVFTDTEPWRGILETDLQGLRYVAEDDYRIQRALEGEVHGELSRQLLLKCLKTRPQDRENATDILDWICQDNVREGLIGEWKMYSSDTRGSRKTKSFYGFEDTGIEEEEKKKPRRKANTPGSKGRGRPKLNKDT